MTSEQLAKYILKRQSLWILDVRNHEDAADWKVEGEAFQYANIPYFELLEGVEAALEQIPADEETLVVCAKEGSSIFVAEQLAAYGRLNVHYLQGGMKEWSEYLHPVKIGDLPSGGQLFQWVRLGKGCLSYMIVSQGEAAVIDAARMTDVYERLAGQLGVKITNTIDTHLHADHISGGRRLAEANGATYWLPPKDAEEISFVYNRLDESTAAAHGIMELIRALYSPGHTIGSTSLIVDDTYLLSGDILFISSIGRPDLAGQAEDWAMDLRHTLYEGYRQLADTLIVLPAHFGHISELGEDGMVSASLGELCLHNPGLQMSDAAEFRHAVTDFLPAQPHAYKEIRQVNMGKLQPDVDEQRDMELGPNRCAIHDS
ncbi:MBL fold metallo-hydrolase [Paenibacillus algorifonticola]|uniref:MBL fold metallo-hydrolase n=1 Tax=Paenibacillus algorifonticola TaxID=684063 RepID=UPI003D2BA4F9